MEAVVSTQKFTVAPSIIVTLIKNQAGSLGKAVMEASMNSSDAQASRVDINITQTGITIQDDGRGFASRAEIDQWFSVFGFDHKDHHSPLGQFGLGRGQLWNYCRTDWRTHGFKMAVDIRKSGLEYDLHEGLEHVNGLLIDATFYDQLTTSDLIAFADEVEDLCAYASIPVFLNGAQISTPASKAKWTHEIPGAYIKLQPVSKTLSVYNMGFKVRDYPAWQVGIGGVVVSTERFVLNMARNDVIQSDCPLWKRVKPFLQKKSDEAAQRQERLSESQMANLAVRFGAREIDYESICKRKLIVDIVGKKHTIEEFLRRAYQTPDKVVTFVNRVDAGPTAEQSHRNGHCFIVNDKTMQRFSATSVQMLLRRIVTGLDGSGESVLLNFASSLEVKENWRDACTRVREGYEEVPRSDWTKKESAAIAALEGANNMMCYIMSRGDHQQRMAFERRELKLGVSDVAQAWTDGRTYVVMNREALERMERGISGVMSLVHILVHEYLHTGPSSGTHVHDEEFYESFEDICCYHGSKGSWVPYTIGDAVQVAMTMYLKECKKRGLKASSRFNSQCDTMEKLAA